MKAINKYSNTDCRKFALKLRDGAEKRWTSGELIETNDKRGAVANWITSIEEYTKACLFILDYRGTKFRSVSGIEELLKHHKARSALICIVFLMKIYGELFLKYIKIFMTDKSKLFAVVAALKNGDEKILNQILDFLSNILKQIKEEAEWFSKLEDLRLTCTYLDDTFNEKKFVSDFETIKIKLKSTKIGLSELFKSFETDEWIKLNKTFINMLNKKDNHFYNHMSKFLIKQRKEKSNPLKIFIKELDFLELDKTFEVNEDSISKFKSIAKRSNSPLYDLV